MTLTFDHNLFQMVDYVGVIIEMNNLQPTVCKIMFKFIDSLTFSFDLESYSYILSAWLII